MSSAGEYRKIYICFQQVTDAESSICSCRSKRFGKLITSKYSSYSWTTTSRDVFILKSSWKRQVLPSGGTHAPFFLFVFSLFFFWKSVRQSYGSGRGSSRLFSRSVYVAELMKRGYESLCISV